MALTLLWIGTVFLVGPSGDFPLNDDWVYATSVRSLLDTGQIRFHYWNDTTLVPQVLWGALFCLPFGFSFTALRLSTLTAGLAGLWGTYGLLRAADASPTRALAGAVVIASNPVYVQLSHTFMTDVPFFALGTLASFCLIRGLRRESPADFLTGSLLAVGTTLVRPVGIAIPLAAAVAYLAKYGLRWRTLATAAWPTLLTLGLLTAYPSWVEMSPQISRNLAYSRQILRTLMNVPSFAAFSLERLHTLAIYLGLFMFPFVLQFLPDVIRQCRLRKRHMLIGAGAVLFLSQPLLSQKRLMPLAGNVLFDLGLGPLTLYDTYLLQLPHWPRAPTGLWLIVTAVGISGAAMFLLGALALLWQRFQHRPGVLHAAKSSVPVFTLCGAALYCLILIPVSLIAFFDRNLLFPLPLLMAICVQSVEGRRGASLTASSRLCRIVGVAVVALSGSFAVGATHDYLAWNRARWQALNDLTERERVDPSRIDGGYEFVGLHSYAPGLWAWVISAAGFQRDEYVVAFGPITGYAEVSRHAFRRWVPPGDGRILVLRRTTARNEPIGNQIGGEPR